MNSFEIHYPDGVPVALEVLDQEAAELWEVPVDRERYARPSGGIFGNWFDSIGWNIANQGHFYKGWDNIKNSMAMIQLNGIILKHEAVQIESLAAVNNYLKPYFALIDHWAAKGYQPVQIKNNGL